MIQGLWKLSMEATEFKLENTLKARCLGLNLATLLTKLCNLG